MTKFEEFMKLTRKAAQLIEEAAGVIEEDDNTEEYLREGGYYDFDYDSSIQTVLNFLTGYFEFE
jgi:hypothetical protein